MAISVSNYTGFDYLSSVRRTIDRESLTYRLTKKVSSVDKTIEYYVERQCRFIDKEIFDAKRLKSAEATKAKQKIEKFWLAQGLSYLSYLSYCDGAYDRYYRYDSYCSES